MPILKINDINMYYEIHGTGTPLLLIAGLSTDVTPYQGIVRALAQEHTVIAFDNRGAGRTDKPDTPYSMEMMADDTAGLLAALDIRPAHVLGVSMGGRIALALTLKHPELVRSLILASTGAKWVPMSRVRQLFDVSMHVPLLRTIGKKYPQPQYAFERQRAVSRRYDATSRLREIHMPTLILHGRKDARAPLRIAEEMHATIQGSQIITFNGGHVFLFFQQAQFTSAVLTFLRDIPESSRD